MTTVSYRIHMFLCDALIDGPDAPPCMFQSTQPYQDMTVVQSRAWAKQDGWRIRGKRAICPQCWTEGYR